VPVTPYSTTIWASPGTASRAQSRCHSAESTPQVSGTVKNAHNEFGFLCTTVKHGFNLDEKPLFLTRFDSVMKAQ